MSSPRYDTDSTDELPVLRERRRRGQIADWITWAVRGITVLIGLGVWQLLMTMNSLEVNMAKMSVTIDDHTTQINLLWQQVLREEHK